MKNEYVIENNDVKITLNHGQFTYIESNDFHLLEKYGKLTAHLDNNQKYYVVMNHLGKQYKLHRVILNMTNPKEKVDHKDLDTLNNRRSNLRKATDSQNGMNRKNHASNTGYKNIMWHKFSQRYQVVIHSKETPKYSYGYFNDIEMAVKHRDEILKQLHGDFAVFDNPTDVMKMPKGKPYRIAGTGYRHISFSNGLFDVRKITNGKMVRQRFKNLTDAIVFRDSLTQT